MPPGVALGGGGAGGGTIIDRLVTELVYRGDARVLDRHQRAARRLEDRLAGLSRGLGRLAGPMMATGGAAAGALATVGAKSIQFSRAQNLLRASTDLTTEQLAGLQRQAISLGAALPLQISEVTEAQRQFIKRGYEMGDVMEALPGIAKFAVAADKAGIEESVQWISTALKSFRMGADQAEHVADVMLLAERKSAASARGIGEGLQFSAKMADLTGMSFDEYAAILAATAEGGRSVESVSQGLMAMFSKISRGLAGFGRGGMIVTEAFQGVGIELEEVRGLMQQENAVAKLLDLMRKRAPNREALVAAFSILGGETYASALGAVSENLDLVQSLFRQFTQVEGEAHRQATIQMEGVAGAWEQLKATWDALLVTQGLEGGTAGWLENTMRGLEGWLKALLAVDEAGNLVHRDLLQFYTTVLKVGFVVGGLGVGLKALSWILGAFAPIVGATSKLLGWLGLTRTATSASVAVSTLKTSAAATTDTLATANATMAAAGPAGVTAATGFGAMIAKLAGPAGLIALLVSAGAALTTMWKRANDQRLPDLQARYARLVQSDPRRAVAAPVLTELQQLAAEIDAVEASGDPVRRRRLSRQYARRQHLLRQAEELLGEGAIPEPGDDASARAKALEIRDLEEMVRGGGFAKSHQARNERKLAKLKADFADVRNVPESEVYAEINRVISLTQGPPAEPGQPGAPGVPGLPGAAAPGAVPGAPGQPGAPGVPGLPGAVPAPPDIGGLTSPLPVGPVPRVAGPPAAAAGGAGTAPGRVTNVNEGAVQVTINLPAGTSASDADQIAAVAAREVAAQLHVAVEQNDSQLAR